MTAPSSDVAIKSLAAYLEAETGIVCLADWPDPKQQLTLPCISIISEGDRGYTNVMETFLKKVPLADNPDLFDVVYNVGEYNYNLQLDIWTDYKSKRGELYEKVHDALNKAFLNDQGTAGLNLVLTDYHDAIASYNQTNYTYPDGEESSQREEWRVKITVQVNYSKLAVKTQSIMKDITITHRISDSLEHVEASDDVKDIEENRIV